ncbi:ATP-binding protein [Sphingoaurantiacus capsulatus]|uniref:histidine kinase n=1 Tax=Sphingoaurantiacus capsulatus TaxID=1771310 RepID=A0ABV7X8R5_9SPHN
MASATDSPRNSPEPDRLTWSKRFSLTQRILAVNLFALIALAGGVFYLDSFRDRLLEQRQGQARVGAVMMADALSVAERRGLPGEFEALAARLGQSTGARIRIYREDGRLILDSWTRTGPTFRLRDPAQEPWRKDAARFLDKIIEFFGSAPRYDAYVEPVTDARAAWPEAEAAAGVGPHTAFAALRRAPDRTVIVNAAAPVAGTGDVLMVTLDTRDITRVVRSERLTFFLIFLGVLALSLLLSSFLARTIVRPLRRLSIAAQRVKLGRAREVTVPRFAKRRDEIGALGRAVADMTQALRHRMDATESFAADVAHEIKNPLASLRSAVDTLGAVKDPALQAQLLDVIRDDVLRIDRLITDIAEVSRLDAQLARTRFEPVDVGQMAATLVRIAERAGLPRGVKIAYARPEPGTAIATGDESRLSQVVRNLLDNAISFTPDNGVVLITVMRAGDKVMMRIDDDGPGIPAGMHEHIFKRFYSERPESESFGKHSGLGLAIAGAIVHAHDGSITALNREQDGVIAGARFVVTIPAAP